MKIKVIIATLLIMIISMLGITVSAEVTGNVEIANMIYTPPSSVLSADSVEFDLIPNGNSKAELYIDGEEVEDIEFEKDSLTGEYKTAHIRWTNLVDTYNTSTPVGVTNFSVSRDSTNPTYLLIQWDDEISSQYILNLEVHSGESEANGFGGWNYSNIDVTSTIELHEVYINGTRFIPDMEYDLLEYNMTGLSALDVPWNSTIKIVTTDATRLSTTNTFSIDNECLYTTIPVDDTVEINGNIAVIDLKANDTFDPAYSNETIYSVDKVTVPDNFEYSIGDALSYGELDNGLSGQVLYVKAPEGYIGDVQLNYCYTSPRADIPQVDIKKAQVNLKFISSAEKPVITSISYNNLSDKLKITVDPKNRDKVYLYVSDTNVAELEFSMENGVYTEKEFEFTGILKDKGINNSPNAVENIKVERIPLTDENTDKKVKISWTGGDDVEQEVNVHVAGEDNIKSDNQSINIKSGKTSKKIKIFNSSYTTDANKISEYDVEDVYDYDTGTLIKANEIDIYITELNYFGAIVITSSDIIDGTSSEAIKGDLQNVVYSANIVADQATINEGESITVDVIANDIHDEFWDVPSIENVWILQYKYEGEFGWRDITSENFVDVAITDRDPGEGGDAGNQVLVIDSIQDDSTSRKVYVKVEYEYEPVAPGMSTGLTGECIVEILPGNSAPWCHNISISKKETSESGYQWLNPITYNINCETGKDIVIPVEAILQFCGDIDGDEVQLANLGSSSNFNTKNINCLNATTSISNTVNWSYINAGCITYEPPTWGNKGNIIIRNQTSVGNKFIKFRVWDGEDYSSWLAIRITLVAPEAPPKAKDDEQIAMQINQFKKNYIPEIEYSGTNNMSAKVDNVYVKTIADTDFVIESTTGSSRVQVIADTKVPAGKSLSVPELLVQRDTGTEWNIGDQIKIEYTVTTENTSNSDTGVIIITLTEGDDDTSNEGYLYVHRKPLSIFSINFKLNEDDNYIDTTDTPKIESEGSYDIDHSVNNVIRNGVDLTDAGGDKNGIRAWDWEIIQMDTNNKWQMTFETNIVVPDGKKDTECLLDIDESGTSYTKTDYYNNDYNSNKLFTYTKYYISSSSTVSGKTNLINTIITKKGTERNIFVARNATEACVYGQEWVNGMMKKLLNANTEAKTYGYMINLKVRDVDGPNTLGTWSETLSSVITSGKMPPVAKFIMEKSVYLIPSNTDEFSLGITDLSQDPNGDDITNWDWVLTGPKGEKVIYDGSISDRNEDIKVQILQWFELYQTNGLPDNAKYKLTLKVTDETGLESEPYSIEFEVYKDNQAPTLGDGQINGIKNYRLYLEDKGEDGVIGDTLGILEANGGSGYANMLHFFPTESGVTTNKFISISDDQSLEDLKLTYIFEGQSVMYLSRYVEDNEADIIKTYTNKKYNEIPFSNTVTEEEFTPGIYRVTVTAEDNPSGILYEGSQAKVSSISTKYDGEPYHISVIPSLYVFPYVEYNGYKFTRYGVVKPGYNYNTQKASEMVPTAEIPNIAPSIGDKVTVYSAYSSEWYTRYPRFTINGTLYSGCSYYPNKRTYDNRYINFRDYIIPDNISSDTDVVSIPVKAVLQSWYGSKNGSGNPTRTKENNCNFYVVPVKLSDFRVTKITDPKIKDELQSTINNLKTSSFKLSTGSAVDGVPVSHLAVDKETVSSGQLMSKGYSFYFKVNSKGLKNDTDYIRITPRFYSVTTDENGSITGVGSEVYGYLPDETGEYKRYTGSDADSDINSLYPLYFEGGKQNSLGDHNTVVLPRSLMTDDGNLQTWEGRYGIPSDAKFSTNNSSLTNEYTGEILIAFKIDAVKNGVVKYNYVERGQWASERSASLKTIYSTVENTDSWKSTNLLGSVLVFNGGSSASDAYISNPVWRE